MDNRDIYDSEKDSTNHFLNVLSGQRHYNIHGEGSSTSILPTVLSLCCLIFWDTISSANFEAYKPKLIEEIRTAAPNVIGWSPYTDFYPVFAWDMIGLMELKPKQH